MLVSWERGLELSKQWENLKSESRKATIAYYKVVGRFGKEEETEELRKKIEELQMERIKFMKKTEMGIYGK